MTELTCGPDGSSNGELIDAVNNNMIHISYVNTISDLSSVDINKNISVNVKGYWAENDGGGGVFNYDATQSAVNNGGTIINGWVRQYSGTINVKWFGAKGDGVTDDRASIQLALDSGYRSVFLPEGKYIIVDSLSIPQFVEIFGSGTPPAGTAADDGRTKLVFSSTTSNACITLGEDSVIQAKYNTIRDLSITTTGSSTYNWIIEAWHSNSLNMYQTNIFNPYLSGGVLKASFHTTPTGETAWVGNFTNNQWAVNELADSYSVQHDISDSQWIGNYIGGGWGVIDTATGGVQYVGCHFDNSNSDLQAAGLTLEKASTQYDKNGKETEIVGCYFDVNQRYGIVLDGSDATADNTHFKVSITGCNFRQGTSALADIRLFGSATYNVLGAIVSACSMTGTLETGPTTIPSFELVNKFKGLSIVGCNNMSDDASNLQDSVIVNPDVISIGNQVSGTYSKVTDSGVDTSKLSNKAEDKITLTNTGAVDIHGDLRPATHNLQELGAVNRNWSALRIASSTGGTGSAGAGNQFVSITINGITYRLLHDGTI